MAGECAKCGACLPVCPVYRVTGREAHTARGKLHLFSRLKDQPLSEQYAELLSSCLLCGACLEVCPRQVDTPALVVKAREELPARLHKKKWLQHLTNRALASPGLAAGLTESARRFNELFLKKLPGNSGLKYRLAFLDAEILPQDSPAQPAMHHGSVAPEAQLAFFPGCFARYVQPQISTATARLAAAAGLEPLHSPASQSCCGLAAHSAGDRDEAIELARKNIAAFADHELPILTSCASCYSHLKSYPELLRDDPQWHKKACAFAGRLQEFSTFFAPRLAADLFTPPSSADRPPGKINYHDPCHLRFGEKITVPPRQLIKLLPDTELLSLPHGPQCCGQGGLFDLRHPDLSGKIMARLFDDFRLLSADTVVTTCTGCLIQWQRSLGGRQNCRARHLAILLADRLG